MWHKWKKAGPYIVLSASSILIILNLYQGIMNGFGFSPITGILGQTCIVIAMVLTLRKKKDQYSEL
ncbi:hypothetical protein [Fulvivirga ligni]|uniref:hypothetical protein n=1 Tax=Fulvivirga ligni TaxID=2904246 RepID=UPI001F1BF6C2|nr:hypothetical protein [Fulvivirga ligni]UII22210.1 hypothetical protein LVD16_03060 [Fulvivirga ligni]